MKKDVKKSSYYVWFLGAQECKNVRDVESIIPVISTLAEREKKVTPYKFTLQVSHRGLKIVHNVSALTSLPGGKSSKSDLVKHLIPDHAVTCVHQDEDLVAVILLLYNPVTKWPVHVHVYRCDSVETATTLAGQLQILIDRPENKKKLNEIELRLTKSELSSSSNDKTRQRDSPPSSSSESGGTPAVGSGNMTTLYDSLAAELKKKLATGGKTGAPILLPPRDYDTVHRHRGNLNGIDFRRCMSTNIVGMNVAKHDFRRSASGTKMGSSGGSSGIGSDHAPSPEQYEPENTYADNNSSSDEDWNASPLEEPLFVKPNSNDHPLPRIRRQDSGVDSSGSPVLQASPEKDYYGGSRHRDHREQHTTTSSNQQSNHVKPRPNHNVTPNMLREKYSDRNVALVQPRPRNSEPVISSNHKSPPIAPVPMQAAPVLEFRRKPVQVRQRTPSPNRPATAVRETPRERFKDAKEKFLMLEKERLDEQRLVLKKCLERQRGGCKDNGTPAAIRSAVRDSCDWSRSQESDEETMDYRNQQSGYIDEEFDDRGMKNVPIRRRENRSRESLDNDSYYNNGGYSKMISNNRRSRNLQQDHDEPRPAPRSYSAEDYLEHNYRPSPPEDHHHHPRYKSPQRRVVPPTVEAPRAAPRRNHHYSDVQQPPASSSSSSSRTNDYKRRSAAYGYEDGSGGCCPPSYGGRHESSSDGRTAGMSMTAADDDGLPPTTTREYKRRSAAYAYEDHHRLQHHHQDLGGSGYRRETVAEDHNGVAYPTAASPVSPRYRHSYAEAYHRHHQQHQQPGPLQSQDQLQYRHNGSLQSSGRIGIAAIHPY